jgi:solute:Na+ symporter, SSS family
VKIEIAVLYSTLLLFLLMGVFLKEKVHSLKDYVLGPKKFSTFFLIATTIATLIGSGSTMGEVGGFYKHGLPLFLVMLLWPINYLFFAFYIVPKLTPYYDCLSIAEILGRMYGPRARKMSGIFAYIMCFSALAMQVKALSFVFMHIFKMQGDVGSVIAFMVIICYTSFGGVAAVVKTDVIQFIIFITILPLIAITLITGHGGMLNILKAMPDLSISGDIGLFGLIGLGFYYLTPGMTPPFIQRLLMGGERVKNQKIVCWVSVCYFINLIFSAFIAFIALAKFPQIKAEVAYFMVVDNFFQHPLINLAFGISLVAVILSTADSMINASAGIVVADILPENKIEKLLMLRIVSVLSGAVALILSLQFKSILDIIWFFGPYYKVLLSVPFVGGLFLVRKTSAMFWYSVGASFLSYTMLKIFAGNLGYFSYVISLMISLIGYMMMRRFRHQ